MNWEAVKGVIERLLYVAAAYAAGKGWIAQSDVASYVALVLGLIGVVFGWYFNRPSVLLDAAAAVVPRVARIELVPKPGEARAVAELAAKAGDKVTAAYPPQRPN